MTNEKNAKIKPETEIDSGLASLVLIARFHQIPINHNTIKHKFAPLTPELGKTSFFTNDELLKASKELGFKSKIINTQK